MAADGTKYWNHALLIDMSYVTKKSESKGKGSQYAQDMQQLPSIQLHTCVFMV